MTDPTKETEPVLCRRCDETTIEDESQKIIFDKYGPEWPDIAQAVKEYDRLIDVDTLCDQCQQEERAEWLNDD